MHKRFNLRPDPSIFYIKVGFEGDERSFKTFPPYKLSKQQLKSSFKLDVAYLRDQFGDVIWPHEWATKCRPPPWKYFMVETSFNHAMLHSDEDPKYAGRGQVFLVNVPALVKSEDLNLWFRAGASASDDTIVKQRDKLAEAIDEHNRVMQTRAMFLRDLGINVVGGEDDDDNTLPPDVQQLPRFQMIRSRREETEEEVNRIKTLIAKLEKNAARLPVKFVHMRTQGEERDRKDDPFAAKVKTRWDAAEEKAKEPDRVHIWKLILPTDRDGSLAKKVLRFTGWVHVALKPSTAKSATIARYLPPGIDHFAGVTEKEEAILLDLKEHGVNMRETFFVSLRHGRGTWRSPTMSVYAGDWHTGRREGRGREIGLSGEYEGDYKAGLRVGVGSLRHPNGDLYAGEFGIGWEGFDTLPLPMHPGFAMADDPPPESISGKPLWEPLRMARWRERQIVPMQDMESQEPSNPYVIGVPHGNGTISFSDGAVYEGQLFNGRPSGHGKYVSTQGEVMEGCFRNGVLHGYGTHRLANGIERVGLWRYGNLIREGVERIPSGEVYKGQFERNARSGRGTTTVEAVPDRMKVNAGSTAVTHQMNFHMPTPVVPQTMTYVGYHKQNAREGLGHLQWINPDGRGYNIFGQWRLNDLTPQSNCNRIVLPSDFPNRNLDAEPLVYFATEYGTLPEPDVRQNLVTDARQRAEWDRSTASAAQVAHRKTAKHVKMGQATNMKKWYHARGIWKAHVPYWKQLVLEQEEYLFGQRSHVFSEIAQGEAANAANQM